MVVTQTAPQAHQLFAGQFSHGNSASLEVSNDHARRAYCDAAGASPSNKRSTDLIQRQPPLVNHRERRRRCAHKVYRYIASESARLEDCGRNR